MAITASIAVTPSSYTGPGSTNVVCTVSNSGGSAVTVTGIQPTVVAKTAGNTSTPTSVGLPNLGPGMNTVVPASGTLAPVWNVEFWAPWGGPGLASPSSQVYTVGATIYTSDGSVTTASTADVTITAPTH